ncbi:8337_t:CDS:10 [Funneliformis caledonium]|uniref:8337_t:CDS:1 n=1 Tax=Funneliformis caledonium TaxID=1117310 RepID=A0A9N8V3V6_9GLOM|nr:8337_t:CDS:10 [Funneliformis caledonium]
MTISSANEFITLLTNLGYPNISNLQPKQILWAYEHLETRNILDWLCTNIDVEQNVIDIKDDWINPSILMKQQKELEDIENEINSGRQTRDHLLRHHDILKCNLENIEGQLADLKRISRDLDEKNEEIDKQIEQDSVKLDIGTAAMMTTISELLSERKLSEGKGKQQMNLIYQCANEITEIMNIDQSFTHELQQLCEMFFSNDIMKKLESYNLADEVARLKNLYPMTQLKYIKACTEFKYLSTFLQVIQNEATRIYSFVPDFNSLKSNLDKNTNSNSLLSKQINYVMDSRIGSSLSNLAYLEVESPILAADCKVRLQSQRIVIDRLDFVIDQLLTQQARNQFVAQTFCVEMYNQESLHRVFLNLNGDLEKRIENINKRMNLMSGADFTEQSINKTVIESHDDFLLSLKNLLNLDLFTGHAKEEKLLPFTTYESLKERFVEIENMRKTSLDKIEQEWESQQELLKSCVEIEKFLKSLLYKDSKTSELLLTPQELSDLQISLRIKINRLQPKLNQITKELDLPDHLESKKKSFIRFFTDLSRRQIKS